MVTTGLPPTSSGKALIISNGTGLKRSLSRILITEVDRCYFLWLSIFYMTYITAKDTM